MSGKRQPISDALCKEHIKRLAKKHNVDAKDIVTKLLALEDKNDFRNGKLSVGVLDLFIKVWKDMGCPDQVNKWSKE